MGKDLASNPSIILFQVRFRDILNCMHSSMDSRTTDSQKSPLKQFGFAWILEWISMNYMDSQFSNSANPLLLWIRKYENSRNFGFADPQFIESNKFWIGKIVFSDSVFPANGKRIRGFVLDSHSHFGEILRFAGYSKCCESMRIRLIH